MTDTNPTELDQGQQDENTGVSRPDQPSAPRPAQDAPKPATGGEGAAGAGGPDGFGTGT